MSLAIATATVGGELRQHFDGWGTTMCWWAGQVGSWSPAKMKEILDLCFSKNGLNLSIVRFNIGGGENPQCPFGAGHMFEARDMPGYASAMTKTKSGADFTWTFDRDKAQQNVLLYLLKETAAGNYRVNYLEAFNNSPPYFMTKSQCASGSKNGDSDNLPDDNYAAFADYVVGVLKWFRDTHKVEFNSLSPFNEPSSWWWKAGGSQEGCAMSIKAQEKILPLLDQKLHEAGLTKTELIASDDNCVDDCYDTYFRGAELDFKTKSGGGLKRINTHTYAGESIPAKDRIELFLDNKIQGRKLWMSEYSSGGLGQHHGTSMDGAIPLAKTIMQDLKYLGVEAWIVWQVIEGWKENVRINQNWGCIWAVYSDFPVGNEVYQRERYHASKQYWVLKQYAHFIQPGSTIITVPIQPDPNNEEISAIGAVNPDGTVIVVAHNLTGADFPVIFDLGPRFQVADKNVERFRTGDEEYCQAVPGVVIQGTSFMDSLPKRTVTTYRIRATPVQGQIPAFNPELSKSQRKELKRQEKKQKKAQEKNRQ
ncbi:glycoside hydrolase superfamily [Hyaloraphidium curvatum]|nr:glycoside hydrolase superfamily [Hyaloraphidium curvatum]